MDKYIIALSNGGYIDTEIKTKDILDTINPFYFLSALIHNEKIGIDFAEKFENCFRIDGIYIPEYSQLEYYEFGHTRWNTEKTPYDNSDVGLNLNVEDKKIYDEMNKPCQTQLIYINSFEFLSKEAIYLHITKIKDCNLDLSELNNKRIAIGELNNVYEKAWYYTTINVVNEGKEPNLIIRYDINSGYDGLIKVPFYTCFQMKGGEFLTGFCYTRKGDVLNLTRKVKDLRCTVDKYIINHEECQEGILNRYELCHYVPYCGIITPYSGK